MGGDRTLVFLYGTLKRGFPNHHLLADLIAAGDAIPVAAAARTVYPLPLVVGPFSLPFLLPGPAATGEARRVSGELYALSPRALAVIDALEGTDRGHYERRPLAVTVRAVSCEEEEEEEEAAAVEAEAYFADRTYATELWQRRGERGLEEYTEELAKEYVGPDDRPRGATTIDAVRIFLASAASPDH